eukprot:SAG11_NODE_919_length_6545_cov_5.571052_3_plen_272_part_00
MQSGKAWWCALLPSHRSADDRDHKLNQHDVEPRLGEQIEQQAVRGDEALRHRTKVPFGASVVWLALLGAALRCEHANAAHQIGGSAGRGSGALSGGDDCCVVDVHSHHIQTCTCRQHAQGRLCACCANYRHKWVDSFHRVSATLLEAHHSAQASPQCGPHHSRGPARVVSPPLRRGTPPLRRGPQREPLHGWDAFSAGTSEWRLTHRCKKKARYSQNCGVLTDRQRGPQCCGARSCRNDKCVFSKRVASGRIEASESQVGTDDWRTRGQEE